MVPPADGLAASRTVLPVDAESVAGRLAESLCKGGTALELDLEPSLGVQVAARLYQAQLAYAVLVLPTWPYAEAILPTAELLTALVVESLRLNSASRQIRNVAFVLDARRQQPVERPADDRRVDNRYQLTVADMPNLAELRRAGIGRVVKVIHA